jgi:peptidyl-prolyl cis-trans isomerase SurA
VKANRLVLLAVAGTSVLALTGCTQSPTVAARVGDETVSTSDVDFLTRMQCDTLDRAAADPQQAQAGNVQTVPKAQVRTGMVNTLVQTAINRQLAAKQHLGYDRTTLREVMDQFEQVVQTVPAKDRDRFRTMVEDVYRGQLQVYTLAQDELAKLANTQPTQAEVDNAVTAIQERYRKTIDVEVNPVYGAGASGVSDPSLSVAVSPFAKQAGSARPDATWVTSLPPNQRCG